MGLFVQSISKRRIAAAAFLASSAILAGCQQGSGPNLGIGAQNAEPAAEAIRESELRAYCPPVSLREGTAYFRTYERGAEGDDSKIIYQASIDDVTRACKYQGTPSITVAVAGRIVPGPSGRVGTITMPIRIAAMRGDEVIYSQLFKHQVSISDTAGATQFLFTDPDIAIPGGIDRGVQLFVGYDEGPYDTP
ncbi:hypothetical protein [Nitratireductor thuwali]|uniref:Lipoprotein n=1 Tax=Nitratireductor thuwali TaxID=2267699 RepID=A0ABY5MPR1_9HYPH|nr:hypothetical protein NTH_03293 [Nitratireductor thuwali]